MCTTNINLIVKVNEVKNAFNNTNIEEQINYIQSSELKNWSVKEINENLHKLDYLDLGIMALCFCC